MERGRGRLVARQVRDGGQQHLTRLGVVPTHVELGHPDLIVAFGGLFGRQRRGQLAELSQRFVPVTILGQGLGAAQSIGGAQLGGRRRGSRGRWARRRRVRDDRGRRGGRSRGCLCGRASQGFVGQRVGGKIARDR